jgi:hypothetical protein
MNSKKDFQFATRDGQTKSDRRTGNEGSREAAGKVAGTAFVTFGYMRQQ